MTKSRAAAVRRAVVKDGRIDLTCEHDAEYEAIAVEEEGIVSLRATCGQGCTDLTLAGTQAGVGIRTFNVPGGPT